MVLLTARSPEEVPQLNELLHDAWFDVDGLVFDDSTRTLRIPLVPELGMRTVLGIESSRPDVERSGAAGEIVIHNVQEWSIKDSEQIGVYDIRSVTFDPVDMTLTILGCIPVELKVIVSAVDIRVEQVTG